MTQANKPSFRHSTEKFMCVTCGAVAEYSILLVDGPDANLFTSRWHIPNQHVREAATHWPDIIQEVWFCSGCMRVIEDAFRATFAVLVEAAKGRVS